MNRAVQELQQLKHKQYLMYLLIFSLVTIVIWVGISLIVSQNTEQVDPELTVLSSSLNPNIDTSALDTLSAKTPYDSQLMQNFPIYMFIVRQVGQPAELTTLQAEKQQSAATPTPTPTPEPTPTLTPETVVLPDTLNPEPESTASSTPTTPQ